MRFRNDYIHKIKILYYNKGTKYFIYNFKKY